VTTEEKIKALFTSLDQKLSTILIEYTRSLTRQKTNIVIKLVDTYIELILAPINNSNNSELIINLVHIRTHLCQNHTQKVAQIKFFELYKLISLIAAKGIIKSDFFFPDKPNSEPKYNIYRSQTIPAENLSKIKPKKRSADEEFYDTLSITCTTAISDRLKEHVYNFKIIKHHRSPLNNFLNFVYTKHQKWYEHSKIIEGSLIEFRNNLLNDFSRNTAYKNFQNLINSFKVLHEHNLIPRETDFPNNLRRCTKTEKVRIDNPLLCTFNIYNEPVQEPPSNMPEFIRQTTAEIEFNLKSIIDEARKIVFEGYRIFTNRERIVSNSERSDLIDFLDPIILKSATINDSKAKNYKCKFFSSKSRTKEIITNNLVAYFDHFYECFIDCSIKHNIEGLYYTDEVKKYLGLTPNLASAMQIIIVEELGINPYSLYRAKVFSDGHGHEFIQITDDGSVRLRALKPRARHVKTREAKGSLRTLSDFSEHEINAATCLKMALEITERARVSTGLNELWLCPTINKVTHPTPDTFQNEFRNIKTKVSLKNKQIKSATLKKIRSSKGVLIYLKSNGDSLKAAHYFGNSVKTTLARYIPQHIAELVYRTKIRAFQNLILFMAIVPDDSPEHTLGLSNKNYKELVLKAFNNPDMGGRLYENLKANAHQHEIPSVKYFCVSLKNIILALKYAKEGEDQSLKDDCIVAISKISEGPIIMKQLLRQAEKRLSSVEGN